MSLRNLRCVLGGGFPIASLGCVIGDDVSGIAHHHWICFIQNFFSVCYFEQYFAKWLDEFIRQIGIYFSQNFICVVGVLRDYYSACTFNEICNQAKLF